MQGEIPAGRGKQLIYAVTRRKVPCGGLPADVGVVVSNVHTAYSVRAPFITVSLPTKEQ